MRRGTPAFVKKASHQECGQAAESVQAAVVERLQKAGMNYLLLTREVVHKQKWAILLFLCSSQSLRIPETSKYL